MKCFFCKKKVEVYPLFIKKGQDIEDFYQVCVSCAELNNIILEAKVFEGTDQVILSYLLKNDLNKICPKCKTKLSTIEATGEVGCANCYEYFLEEIKSLMNFKTLNYVGKIPKSLKKSLDLSEYKSKLNRRLKIAILREDYENAVKLRDKLNSINEEF